MRTARDRKTQLSLIILLLFTAAVYWPVYRFDFINYDDNLYVYENPHVREGLTRDSLRWALTADMFSDSPYADFWAPATFVSHLLVAEFFGLDPSAHHVANLFLHLMNVLLLFWALNRMTGALWPSAFVAALFAVHPLHVESVAWVTERKDVLSGFFFMLILGAYLRYTEKPGVARYLVVVSAFALGLMAKPMLVTVPFVLLLLDYWPLGRLRPEALRSAEGRRMIQHRVLEKLPLILLVGASVAITILGVRRAGGIATFQTFTWDVRLTNSLTGYAAYIGKTFWPTSLSVFYPHPVASIPVWKWTSSGLMLLTITAFFASRRVSSPYLLVGWLWFLGMLVPVIGIMTASEAAMADRYMYLPIIGLFLVSVWGGVELGRRARLPATSLFTIAVAVTLIACMISLRQVSSWKNSVSLFEHALRVTDRNYVAHNNIGTALHQQGRFSEAVEQFLLAVRANPRYAVAYINLGNAYKDLGRLDDAIREYVAGVKLDPQNLKGHYNLSVAYAEAGRLDEAAEELRAAIRISPDLAEAHNNLGNIFYLQGKWEAAMEKYKTTLRVTPDHVEAIFNLGLVYEKTGMFEEARTQYQRVLEIKPDSIEAREAIRHLPR